MLLAGKDIVGQSQTGSGVHPFGAQAFVAFLGGRNADVILRPGTTLELVLDRDLTFSESELAP